MPMRTRGEGSKNPKFCGHHIWKLPKASPLFATVTFADDDVNGISLPSNTCARSIEFQGKAGEGTKDMYSAARLLILGL